MNWGIDKMLPAICHAVYSAPDASSRRWMVGMFVILYIFSTCMVYASKVHDGEACPRSLARTHLRSHARTRSNGAHTQQDAQLLTFHVRTCAQITCRCGRATC
jgi:hypothetical protein